MEKDDGQQLILNKVLTSLSGWNVSLHMRGFEAKEGTLATSYLARGMFMVTDNNGKNVTHFWAMQISYVKVDFPKIDLVMR